MRRWFGLMAACGLLALTATGCEHTAGVCDCDLGGYHGYGAAGYDLGAVHSSTIPMAPAPTPVPSETMSRTSD